MRHGFQHHASVTEYGICRFVVLVLYYASKKNHQWAEKKKGDSGVWFDWEQELQTAVVAKRDKWQGCLAGPRVAVGPPAPSANWSALRMVDQPRLRGVSL